MPPSTVFSYWRRDHRRSSASPVSSAQPTPAIASSTRSASNPPRLPVIPNTAALPTTFGSSSATADGLSPQSWGDFSPDLDADKTNVAVSATSVNAPSSSSTNLAVPSAVSENNVRPHSSPEECDRDPSITSQSNSSQPSFTAPRPECADGESSKPNSPFRRSFGKGFLNAHTPSSDNQSKRLSTPGIAHSSPFRLRASPDGSPAEKTTASQKESRFETASHRRQIDRDVPADHTNHHKSGKTRLHLLNPMSLLARRRSSQIATSRTEDVKIGARNLVPAIPDDYDPRIRGNIVHDFSAPRPRRNLSAAPVLLREVASRNSSDQPRPTNGTQRHVSDQILTTSEQNKRHSEHSPAFKEHFEDDQRALQVENKGYLHSTLLTNPPPRDRDAQSLPVFARNLPAKLPEQDEKPDDPPPKESPPAPPSSEPVNVPQDSDTIEFVPHQPSGLPKHLKSNASRFSFDMNGVESSTQEKLLEEKHKEKEAARRAKARLEDPEFSDGEDDYDNELLDDLDGLEEKIPGVNADADEDDQFSGFSGPGDILNKSWLAPGLSPVIASPISPNAPSLPTTTNESSQPAPAPPSNDLEDPTAGLSASSEEPVEVPPPLQPTKSPAQVSQIPTGPPPNATQFLDDDDDLYFDDGEFGDLTADVGDEGFDESIFDDETSHLYDRKRTSERTAPAPAPAPAPQQESEKQDDLKDALSSLNELSLETGPNGGLKHVPSMASEYRPGSRKYSHVPEDVHNAGSAKSPGGVLSEHNLEALHNALAKAAVQTAPKDRFDRNVSVSERSLNEEDDEQPMSPQPGLVSDDSHLNRSVDMASFEQGFEDFDYDDNDASFYDDPIIAAANAEALENDDDGFYGQEFGFYAQAHGNGELTNGGYFGPRGVEGITRSFSSRGKFREPSLTPITERSELGSTRNSMISVSAHGAAHSNPLSPGLAQLVDLGNLEDEISLSALMKLRRGAWGGSNGSLRSSSGSPPPNLQTASNRASFTGLSDVSPTAYNAPPDLFGGSSATESPIRESYKGAFT